MLFRGTKHLRMETILTHSMTTHPTYWSNVEAEDELDFEKLVIFVGLWVRNSITGAQVLRVSRSEVPLWGVAFLGRGICA